MSRKGENIRKRKDGRWEARVLIGRTPEGKSKYKYLFGHSYREVKEKKKEFIIEWEQHKDLPPETPSSNVTFSHAATLWLDTVEITVKQSTFCRYQNLLEYHILPYVGTMTLQDLNAQIISDMMVSNRISGNQTTGGPLSSQMLQSITTVTKRVLHYAQSREWIREVPKIQSVTVRTAPVQVFTRAEQALLEEKAYQENTPFSLGIFLALYTGLRIGEVCTLQWQDIDWVCRTLHVSKTVNRIPVQGKNKKTELVVGSPKTLSSNRYVPIPDGFLSYLQERRRGDNCYVVTGTRRLLDPRIYRRQFSTFLKKADIPQRNFHVCRHTYASRCIEEGVDYKTVSENLGHSDVKITLSRYVHLSMEQKQKQVSKLPIFDFKGSKIKDS